MYRIIGADEKEYGPISLDQLRQWIAEGRANGQTRVLPEGSTEWKTVNDIPELAALPGRPAAPAPVLQQTYVQAGQAPKTNLLAIISLVCGIISFAACCCYGLPFNLAGIVCAIIALNQIKNDPLNQQGKGLAIAGLIVSIASIVLMICLLIAGVAVNRTDLLRRIQNMQ
jgi:hypothetical protein